MRRRSLAAIATLLTALGVPALASATTVGPTRLAVSPAHPGTRTAVVVRFTQPTIGGTVAGQTAHESLQVTGPARTGCASGTDRALAAAPTGTSLREVFTPGRMAGHRWCTGLHRVALTVAVSSPCPVGPERVICPQYVIVPMTVATARFRISSR